MEAVGHGDVLSRSQWPHFLATCLHKRKGHSNLNIKSLLGPRRRGLWRAYQRTGCDVYAVEFILTRSCRSMALRRFPCESCKTIEGDAWLRRSKRKGQRGGGGGSGNLAAFFYQEYANRCMEEGYKSGMGISSSGTTMHANVLTVHFPCQICHMLG